MVQKIARMIYLWLPVACLLYIFFQLHVLLHVIRVLLLQNLDLSFQVTQIFQFLLVRVNRSLIFGHFVRSLS